MKRNPQFSAPSDEEEMRAFYASCGVSQSTTEAAIKVRRAHPAHLEKQQKPPHPSKGKPKRTQKAIVG
jgi:hypothetical protein